MDSIYKYIYYTDSMAVLLNNCLATCRTGRLANNNIGLRNEESDSSLKATFIS